MVQRPLFLSVAALLLVAFVGLALVRTVWRGPGPGPVETDDPRLYFPTVFRNVQPGVQYVGDDSCTGCHADVSATYHRHSMGRSAAPIGSQASIQRYDTVTGNPFVAEGLRYSVEERQGRVFHKEQVPGPGGRALAEREAEVAFTIGSGERGVSYILNQDGYLFQSPISWYAQKNRWGLSPGYEDRPWHFDRILTADCLFCHCNRLEPIAHTRNRYAVPLPAHLALGCERCHGPGALHMQQQQVVEGVDRTIVNPRHLEPALAEAVCQQCHLQGQVRVLARNRQPFDYRPGLPLQLFWDVFEWAQPQEDQPQAVGHVEQMHSSRCYIESGKANAQARMQLTCTSCHDPHQLPEQDKKVVYYRQKCLACHQEAGCSLPSEVRLARNKVDSCTACHMPRSLSRDIAHTAVTDHRILRDGAPPRGSPASSSSGLLVSFYASRPELIREEAARNLGLALAQQAQNVAPGPLRLRRSEEAIPLLDEATLRARDDVNAWEALVHARTTQGFWYDALRTSKVVLNRAPEREATLVDAAVAAEHLEQYPVAREHWQRGIAVNPWRASYHFSLARMLAAERQWSQAREAAATAVRLEPGNPEYRLLLLLAHLRTGERSRAMQGMDVLVAMPENRDLLRRWFTEQSFLQPEERSLFLGRIAELSR